MLNSEGTKWGCKNVQRHHQKNCVHNTAAAYTYSVIGVYVVGIRAIILLLLILLLLLESSVDNTTSIPSLCFGTCKQRKTTLYSV
jgi:hypothetical protein